MAPLSNIIHVVPIIEELQRIGDSLIKSLLTPNLVSINIGDITAMPSPGVAALCPGLWIQPTPATTNEFMYLPKPMLQKYFFRVVYVRLIQPNENIVKKAMLDAAIIVNTYCDKMLLPDITNLPTGTQIMWAMTKSIEWRPPEDDYVVRCHADLTAIAFNMEINVKTRRTI
jgi:hypothetical protein